MSRFLWLYTVENGAIRISLRQLKGMSEEALNSILSEREKSDFCSLRDFVMRTEVNRSIAENLINVGAFDSLGTREELMHELPKLRVVYVIMEDGTGIADITVFSDTQRKCGDVLFKEDFLVVTGKVQRRGPKSLSIIADEIGLLKG
ncbi:OB-fold nucleic acid binding domain-containing protein [Chloroflexota bacterium]